MTEAQTWTVARLLAWTREYLERQGLETPRLCAELLLAHALGCDRIRLFTQHERIPDDAVLRSFRGLVKEAATGRPIAYLLERKDFFSLPFRVTPAVLVPRPETETLVERVIEQARGRGAVRIVDIGTGSGCIALALARHLPDAKIHASDVSEAALDVARQNAAALGLTERVEFRLGDLVAPWRNAQLFDLLVSNPPYVGLRERGELPANVRDFEPATALFGGEDGLDFYRRLAVDAATCLSTDGAALLEVGAGQAPEVAALFAAEGWADIVTYKDTLRHDRVVHARRSAARESGAVA